MEKRVVVAGCRWYENYEEACEFIDLCIENIKEDNEIIFISGRCKGADMLGERYAKENGYKIEYFPANWDLYGKSAGPIRNREMAKAADFVICFWDNASRGTKSMIDFSLKLSKPTKIKIISK